MANKKIISLCSFTIIVLLSVSSMSHSSEGKTPLTTESYYRVKWGYFDEFLDLFKKNHYPILKEMQKLGYVESIIVDIPINHAHEEARWDIRITMVIPDTAALKREMPKAIQKLYPDQDKLKKEEAQRFRLLLAHQDIMIRREDISNW